MKKKLITFVIAGWLSMFGISNAVMASEAPVNGQVIEKSVITEQEEQEFAARDTGAFDTMKAGISNADLTLYVLLIILVILIV